MPRKGRTRKKTRTHKVEDETAKSALVSNDPSQKIPKSVVVRRGKVESEVSELIQNIRHMMMPHTALQLNASLTRRLKLVDYAKQMSSTLGVTHILSFSQNPHEQSSNLNLRIARAPSGPTLSFQVREYSLVKDVRKIQKRPIDARTLYEQPPVVVTNHFGDTEAAPHVKLLRITFQNMFPAINVADVKLRECKRVVLFHRIKKEGEKEGEKKKEGDGHDDDNNTSNTEEIEVRHYAIRANPVGVDRKVRKIIQRKPLPHLGRHHDVSDYLLGAGHVSDASDSEDEGTTNHVVLPQAYTGRGNLPSQTSALKLVELGPRLRLRLIKVERGLGDGDVMYHAHHTKTPEEVRQTKQRKEQEAALKRQRRDEQEANVRRKTTEREEKKQRKRQRIQERERLTMDELRTGGGVLKYKEIERQEDDGESTDREDLTEDERESESDDSE